MLLGIDLDNTIVCYDHAFHHAAASRELIPAQFPISKEAICQHIRAEYGNDVWTELQGAVYGPLIGEAQPMPGVWHFFEQLAKRDIPFHIISHKTRLPAKGPAYDLQHAALRWLEENKFFERFHPTGTQRCVHFGETRDQKQKRIGSLKCTHFIDDLPEVLTDPMFPNACQGVLFDPHQSARESKSYKRFFSWEAIEQWILT